MVSQVKEAALRGSAKRGGAKLARAGGVFLSACGTGTRGEHGVVLRRGSSFYFEQVRGPREGAVGAGGWSFDGP